MSPEEHRYQGLHSARERFPEHGDLIETEYLRSDGFRTLCEDLGLCTNALHRWRRCGTSIAPSRVEEYTQALAELETELGAWLVEREKSVQAPGALIPDMNESKVVTPTENHKQTGGDPP